MQSISYTYTSIHSTKNIIEFTQYLAVYPKHDLKFPSSHMGGRLLPAGCQVQRWQTQTKPIQNFHGNCPSIPYLLNSKSQTIKKKHTILQKKTLKRTGCTWNDAILERQVIFFNHWGRVEKRTWTHNKCISQAWLRWFNLHVLRWFRYYTLTTSTNSHLSLSNNKPDQNLDFPEMVGSRAMFAVASLEFEQIGWSNRYSPGCHELTQILGVLHQPTIRFC